MQIVGFVLIGIGVVSFVGLVIWGVIKVLALIFGGIPLIVTIIVATIGAGILILIGAAMKDRRKQAKKDDFKEVER